MRLWPFSKKPPEDDFTFNLSIPPDDPINTLGIHADPVVFYHEMFGQVLMLVPTPCPDILPYEEVYNQSVTLYDVAESGLVPKAYYRRDNANSVFRRTA